MSSVQWSCDGSFWQKGRKRWQWCFTGVMGRGSGGKEGEQEGMQDVKRQLLFLLELYMDYTLPMQGPIIAQRCSWSYKHSFQRIRRVMLTFSFSSVAIQNGIAWLTRSDVTPNSSWIFAASQSSAPSNPELSLPVCTRPPTSNYESWRCARLCIR